MGTIGIGRYRLATTSDVGDRGRKGVGKRGGENESGRVDRVGLSLSHGPAGPDGPTGFITSVRPRVIYY